MGSAAAELERTCKCVRSKQASCWPPAHLPGLAGLPRPESYEAGMTPVPSVDVCELTLACRQAYRLRPHLLRGGMALVRPVGAVLTVQPWMIACYAALSSAGRISTGAVTQPSLPPCLPPPCAVRAHSTGSANELPPLELSGLALGQASPAGPAPLPGVVIGQPIQQARRRAGRNASLGPRHPPGCWLSNGVGGAAKVAGHLVRGAMSSTAAPYWLLVSILFPAGWHSLCRRGRVRGQDLIMNN